MPDEVARLAPQSDGPLPAADFLDLTCEFAHSFPAWCRCDGLPLSWRHFVHGLGFMARHHARESLRLAAAGGMAHAKPEAAREWYALQRAAAGWR